ncbi:spore germination protein GerPC [Effusibacillus pohliae]|uniref:spore germination protein GerPC n=1 Tax=Effusibacillus pohliae TaxID=232270 RepID=UPI0012EA5737|nr:spore germination protein GerPC [Effusibacillus pohliae]
MVIYLPWHNEILELKERLRQIEEELKQLREQPRFGTIEYHIENLTVDSIQNGILDLGVHMGNEMDKRIQATGDEVQGEAKRPTKLRIQDLERSMQEVTDKLLTWEQRWESVEQRLQSLEELAASFERRLRYLEDLHP